MSIEGELNARAACSDWAGGHFGAMFGFAEGWLPCKTLRVQPMGRIS
jgi:hypothetical protein